MTHQEAPSDLTLDFTEPWTFPAPDHRLRRFQPRLTLNPCQCFLCSLPTSPPPALPFPPGGEQSNPPGVNQRVVPHSAERAAPSEGGMNLGGRLSDDSGG